MPYCFINNTACTIIPSLALSNTFNISQRFVFNDGYLNRYTKFIKFDPTQSLVKLVLVFRYLEQIVITKKALISAFLLIRYHITRFYVTQ